MRITQKRPGVTGLNNFRIMTATSVMDFSLHTSFHYMLAEFC